MTIVCPEEKGYAIVTQAVDRQFGTEVCYAGVVQKKAFLWPDYRLEKKAWLGKASMSGIM